MFGSFGATEILLIALVLILFFGAKKIPEMARGIGQGINEFRKVSSSKNQDEIGKEQQEGPKEEKKESENL